MNLKPTKEELRDMRDEGMTLYQISREYNTTIPVIFQLEIEYGINSWSFNLKYVITKEDIESMYVDEHMTQEEIAKELGCSLSPVRDMMNHYHISTRVQNGKYTPQQRSSISDEIVRLHNDEHMTQEEIGKKVGYTQGNVKEILHEHGVPTRWYVKFTPQQRASISDEIVRLYKYEHLNQEEIAEKVGYSRAQVYRILRERGVQTRGPTGTITTQKVSSITADKIQYCIDKGMNQSQIAEYFNIHDATLYKLTEKFGIPGMVSNYRCTTPEYLRWRRKVLKRDNYTCQMCGKTGGRLEVHHVIRWADAPELRYNVDNGVPLCHDCHQKVNGHEYEYAQQFLDITQPQYREHDIIESMPWEPPLELHSIINNE